MKEENPANSFLARYGTVLGWLAGGTLLLLFLIASAVQPFAQWERARNTGGQYYAHLTEFNKDLNELEFLNRQYASVPVRDTSLDRKVSATANYTAKAKEAVTSWSYFQSFIRQNDGALRKWSVDTAAALSKIDAGRSVVRTTTGSMTSDLDRLLANQTNEASAPYSALKNDLQELAK
jgi:hypothetical protein